MKIRPGETDLFNVNLQTDRHDEVDSRFGNSVNAPKITLIYKPKYCLESFSNITKLRISFFFLIWDS